MTISYYEKVGDKVENISDEIPFELPDGWFFVRLKELWELISGRDLSPSEYNADGVGIPYITGASNFVDGKVELARWTTSPQVITEAGDLLLTCKGTIGGMAFNDFGNAHIARQIMAIRNTFALNSEYLALCNDRFYKESVKKHHISSGNYNKKSVCRVAKFYCDHEDSFEKLRLELSECRIEYPPMKLMDMCFWQDGYISDSKHNCT